jgi:ketosteroid isomerase-like protein/DNA-binding CsgD family transcriptional regulator
VSSDNLELVRRHYEDWNRGDTDAVIAAFAPDVEWHGHPRLPEPGPYTRRAEVERWMAQFREAWGELSAEPIELIDAGDSVVALVHMTGRGRGSGVEVQGGVDVHVMTLGGDGITYFQIHPGDIAADRAGLTELEMDVLILRVASELAPAEIADRLDREVSEVEEILGGAFEKLRQLPIKETT